MGVKQHRIHSWAALIIIASVLINSASLYDGWNEWGTYYVMFLAAAIFDVISVTMKESLVRTQPLDQVSFNLKISIGQLLLGLAISPVILMIQ